jgi:hypothetical protein
LNRILAQGTELEDRVMGPSMPIMYLFLSSAYLFGYDHLVLTFSIPLISRIFAKRHFSCSWFEAIASVPVYVTEQMVRRSFASFSIMPCRRQELENGLPGALGDFYAGWPKNSSHKGMGHAISA